MNVKNDAWLNNNDEDSWWLLMLKWTVFFLYLYSIGFQIHLDFYRLIIDESIIDNWMIRIFIAKKKKFPEMMKIFPKKKTEIKIFFLSFFLKHCSPLIMMMMMIWKEMILLMKRIVDTRWATTTEPTKRKRKKHQNFDFRSRACKRLFSFNFCIKVTNFFSLD